MRLQDNGQYNAINKDLSGLVNKKEAKGCSNRIRRHCRKSP